MMKLQKNIRKIRKRKIRGVKVLKNISVYAEIF